MVVTVVAVGLLFTDYIIQDIHSTHTHQHTINQSIKSAYPEESKLTRSVSHFHEAM